MKAKTLFLLLIMGVILAASVMANYTANYTPEDIPAITTDAVATVGVQFMFTGLYRLFQMGMILYVLALALIAGAKWVIHKIEGK